jgi:prostamide/prostaglandin F2alpha synthase
MGASSSTPAPGDVLKESVNLTVKRLDGESAGSVVSVPELWNRPGYKGALVYLIRRAGCKLCRAEGVQLAAIKDQLEEQGYLLVGVVGEELGHEEFSEGFFNGEMYLDEGRKLSKIMASGTQQISGYVNFLLGGEIATEWARAGKLGVQGNLKGNGVNLGGVWVIKGGDEPKVLIEYQEKHWGDAVAVSDVLAAVGAVPVAAKMVSKRVSSKRQSAKRESKKAESNAGEEKKSKRLSNSSKRSSKRTSTKPRTASKKVEAAA